MSEAVTHLRFALGGYFEGSKALFPCRGKAHATAGRRILGEVILEPDGRRRLLCSGGCSQADILKAHGLTADDLAPDPSLDSYVDDATEVTEVRSHSRAVRTDTETRRSHRGVASPTGTGGGVAVRGSWDPFADIFAYVTTSGRLPSGRLRFPAPSRNTSFAVGKHMGPEGTCYLSTATISKETGLGPTAVREAIGALVTGEDRVFNRKPGGARLGDGYTASIYTLADHVVGFAKRTASSGEGLAKRGSRPPRELLGDAEEPATRGRRVRQAVTNDPINDPTNDHTRSGVRAGLPLDEISCPGCGKIGHLVQSPGRRGNPPGWWCRRGPGCGQNFHLADEQILGQLTPGARRSIEGMMKTGLPTESSSKPAPFDPVAQALKNIAENGIPLGGTT